MRASFGHAELHHMRILHWASLTSPDLARLAKDNPLPVLPLAAIEQHGPHLPLSTDQDIGEGILAAACRQPALQAAEGTILILPSLALGCSLEHTGYAGTLSLTPELAMAQIEAIGQAVNQAGCDRLLLFNSHGGNRAVADMAALKLRAALGLLVVKAHYFRFAPPADVVPAQELAHGVHGGALETAMMLHLAPESVRQGLLPDAPSRAIAREAQGATIAPGRDASFAWMAEDLHPCGAIGQAHLASAAMGERLVAHFAARLAEVMIEAMRADYLGSPD